MFMCIDPINFLFVNCHLYFEFFYVLFLTGLDELLDTTRGDDTIRSSLFAYFLQDGSVLLATFLIDPEGPLDFKQHALFKSADHPMMLYVREFLLKQLDTINNEHARLETHLGENNTQRGCFASISWPASENPEEIFQATFGMLMECNAFHESGSYPWLGVHRKNSQRMTANGFCMTAFPNLVFSPYNDFMLLSIDIQPLLKEGINLSNSVAYLNSPDGAKFVQIHSLAVLVRKGEAAFIPPGRSVCVIASDQSREGPDYVSFISCPIWVKHPMEDLDPSVKTSMIEHNNGVFQRAATNELWKRRRAFWDSFCAATGITK